MASSEWKLKAGELCYCQQRTAAGVTCMAEMPCRWHDPDWKRARVGNHGMTMIKRRLKRDVVMREQLQNVIDAIDSMT